MDANVPTTPLMKKNVNDLTVGDALKINLVVLAVMAAVPVAIVVGAAVRDFASGFKQGWKNRKLNQNPEQK